MKSTDPSFLVGFLMLFVQITATLSELNSLAQFSSHVHVNTPARSYSHGVGDPISTIRARSYQQHNPRGFRRLRIPSDRGHFHNGHFGYPRIRPTVPFFNEDIPQENSINAPWQHHDFYEKTVPVLPPSPYKVDSPDPESLWPEGLFIPPLTPRHFGSSFIRRNGDNGQVLSDEESLDPYLVEGSEAIAAVTKADDSGFPYFHLIPHINSLLSNQETRTKNNLKPHRIGSIRHTWPYNRP